MKKEISVAGRYDTLAFRLQRPLDIRSVVSGAKNVRQFVSQFCR